MSIEKCVVALVLPNCCLRGRIIQDQSDLIAKAEVPGSPYKTVSKGSLCTLLAKFLN